MIDRLCGPAERFHRKTEPLALKVIRALKLFQSQTMRTLLPGSLTFLHASCFSAPEDGGGGEERLVKCRLGAAGPVVLRSETRLSDCGATGKAPLTAGTCPYSMLGGGRSQKRLTSSGRGMMMVPS